MLPRQFASQKALLDYAEQKGLVYVWAYTQRERVISSAFTAREHLLSPDQYELVDVRTRSGVRRALLFPKAILQAEFEANREVLAIKARAMAGEAGGVAKAIAIEKRGALWRNRPEGDVS